MATGKFPPIKNAEFRATFPILDAVGNLVPGVTSIDTERSIDSEVFEDCTNEAVEISSSGMYYIDLTESEMNGDTVAVIIKSTEGKTTPLIFYPVEGSFNEIYSDTSYIETNVDLKLSEMETNITNDIAEISAETDPDAIAGAVWNAVSTNYVVAGSFGNYIDVALSTLETNITAMETKVDKLRETLYPKGVNVNTENGTSGDTEYVNGTIVNHVDNIAHAITIAGNLGIKDYFCIGNNGFTLTGTSFNGGQRIEVDHHDAVIDLASVDVSNLMIRGGSLTGTAPTTPTGELHLENVRFDGSPTIPETKARNCSLDGTITLNEAGDYEFAGLDCTSASGSSTLDYGAAGQKDVVISNLTGILTIDNMKTSDFIRISGEGNLVLNASCTGGQIRLSGHIEYVNFSTGTFTVDRTNPSGTKVQQDTILSTGGSGPWTTGSGDDANTIASAVWSADPANYIDTNTMGNYIDYIYDNANRKLSEMETNITNDIAEISAETDPDAIAGAVWNAVSANYVVAGSFGNYIDVALSSIESDITIVDSNVDYIYTNADRKLSEMETNMTNDIIDVKSDTTAIEIKTDQMNFTDSQYIQADAVAIANETNSAEKLRDALKGSVKGTVKNTISSFPSTAIVLDNLDPDVSVAADLLNNRVLTFTTGLANGQSVAITDTTVLGSTITVIVTDIVDPGGNIEIGDKFIIA